MTTFHSRPPSSSNPTNHVFNGKIVDILGKRSAERYVIARAKEQDQAYFFLPLAPEQIEILRR